MKVNVDYLVVHEAIEKLENGDALNDKEKQGVLAVLRAVQGDYIPTKEELERQERNIRLLDLYNPESDGFNRIYEQVLEFENKYC